MNQREVMEIMTDVIQVLDEFCTQFGSDGRQLCKTVAYHILAGCPACGSSQTEEDFYEKWH